MELTWPGPTSSQTNARDSAAKLGGLSFTSVTETRTRTEPAWDGSAANTSTPVSRQPIGAPLCASCDLHVSMAMIVMLCCTLTSRSRNLLVLMVPELLSMSKKPPMSDFLSMEYLETEGHGGTGGQRDGAGSEAVHSTGT